MLFEGRLGGKVYRPIGVEWAEQGYWKVYDHPATVKQFLEVGGATPDGTEPVNQLVDTGPIPGLYHCKDIDSGFTNKAITLEAFMSMPFDLLIASIPAHIEPYKKLAALHPNHPKVIFQIGNAWTVEAGMAPNVMASAIIHDVPSDINFISYHQEFDLNVFSPFHKVISDDNDLVFPTKKISSFVNCFGVMDHLAADFAMFQEVERLMPDWDFRAYGGQCRDGAAHGAKELADKMREARFVWHTKAGGDGYGHVIHNAAALAKPLIVKAEYYRGKMAEPLLKDGETCICIDGLSYPEVINKINHFSQSDLYIEMSRKAYENFTVHVDFDKEAEAIKEFLGRLK